jgi:hypothetical protein
MKTSKFSEAQIAFVLRQAEEGTAIGEVCRKAGISEARFYDCSACSAAAKAPRGRSHHSDTVYG